MCLLVFFFICLLIFGAWALSNVGKEGVILGKAWTQFSAGQKATIQANYECCGANFWGQATNLDNCPLQCRPKNSCPGCFPAMIGDMRKLYTAFGVIFVIVAAIMLVTIISTFCLMSSVANSNAAKGGKGKRPGRR